jgi:beta-galactosidase
VLETIIYDADHREVASGRSKVSASRFAKKTVRQELTVKKPNLWSVDAPHLYRAESVLKSGKVVLDRYPTTFGIRSIEFDAERGFFLNGENLKMKGVCLHHDAGSFGAAVPDASIWRFRLEKMKELGCNAIRTAHNPASDEFMDLCDELGFLVMNEFVDKWDKTYRPNLAEDDPFYDVSFFDPNFSDEWKRNFESTILRDRNRPSVIIWSVGNENHPPESPGQKNGLRTYASFVRSLDPTRPVISGMERGKDYKGKNIVERKVNDIIDSCRYMDLIALNYGEQWCKMIAEKKPGKPFLSTESYRYFNSTPEVRFASVERSPWLDALENDNNMGVFLWPGIGYLGESRTYPKAGGNSGLISSAEFRQHVSYLYEAFWTEEPMVYLAIYEEDPDTVEGTWGTPKLSRNWNRTAGETTHAATYSNCDSVNLYLNGKLLGNRKLADVPNWIMKWRDIAFEEGTLTAKGVVDGAEVCESTVKTAGEASRIQLTVDEESLKSAGFVRIELQLTDDAGLPVPFSEKELTFSIGGDAVIFALNNGNGDVVNSRLNTTSRPTYLGRCLCLVKKGSDTGAFTLTVNGPGLEAAVFERKQ